MGTFPREFTSAGNIFSSGHYIRGLEIDLPRVSKPIHFCSIELDKASSKLEIRASIGLSEPSNTAV
jgi:hypothetical protein